MAIFPQRNDFKIEVCANSVASVLAARAAGADRVELCAGMPEGGTTPSYGCIKEACAIENIRVNVIIRPRGGDFLYDEIERRIILEDIAAAKELGADGIVCGMLTAEGDIDGTFLSRCVQAAAPLPFTFHRAFDMCNEPFRALRVLEECGCTRLLTSGMKPSAEEGSDLIARLIRQNRNIIIMPGCGINAANIRHIARSTQAREFHLSGRIRTESEMLYRNPHVSMGGSVTVDEYAHEVTSSDKVRELIEALQA